MKRLIYFNLILFINLINPTQAIELNQQFSGISLNYLESSNSNYDHDTISLRAHFNSKGWNVKSWEVYWSIEPNINWYEHTLKNPLYIKEDEPDYLAQRKRFTSGIDFLLAGVEGTLSARKKLSKRGYLELSAGIGIAYLESETERQAKGFTFTETGRAGYSFETSHGEFFIGYTIMHVSNAGLDNPNGGYDLSGVSIRYQKQLKILP